jgi:hypothetical protein
VRRFRNDAVQSSSARCPDRVRAKVGDRRAAAAGLGHLDVAGILELTQVRRPVPALMPASSCRRGNVTLSPSGGAARATVSRSRGCASITGSSSGSSASLVT